MHISHLALIPDLACSVLLDLTDSAMFVDGTSRDKRLAQLYQATAIGAKWRAPSLFLVFQDHGF